MCLLVKFQSEEIFTTIYNIRKLSRQKSADKKMSTPTKIFPKKFSPDKDLEGKFYYPSIILTTPDKKVIVIVEHRLIGAKGGKRLGLGGKRSSVQYSIKKNHCSNRRRGSIHVLSKSVVDQIISVPENGLIRSKSDIGCTLDGKGRRASVKRGSITNIMGFTSKSTPKPDKLEKTPNHKPKSAPSPESSEFQANFKCTLRRSITFSTIFLSKEQKDKLNIGQRNDQEGSDASDDEGLRFKPGRVSCPADNAMQPPKRRSSVTRRITACMSAINNTPISRLVHDLKKSMEDLNDC